MRVRLFVIVVIGLLAATSVPADTGRPTPGFYQESLSTDGKIGTLMPITKEQSATLAKPFSDFSSTIADVDGEEQQFPINPTTKEPDFSATPTATEKICAKDRTTLGPFLMCLREHAQKYDREAIGLQSRYLAMANALRAHLDADGKETLNRRLKDIDFTRDDFGAAIERLSLTSVDCPEGDAKCAQLAEQMYKTALATGKKADVFIRSYAMINKFYDKYKLPNNFVIFTKSDANVAAAEKEAGKLKGENRVANCKRRFIDQPEKPRFEVVKGKQVDWYLVCLDYRADQEAAAKPKPPQPPSHRGSSFRDGDPTSSILDHCNYLANDTPINNFCEGESSPLRNIMPGQVMTALNRFTVNNYLELLRMEAISTIITAHQTLVGQRLSPADAREEIVKQLREAGCGGLSEGIANEVKLPPPLTPRIKSDPQYRAEVWKAAREAVNDQIVADRMKDLTDESLGCDAATDRFRRPILRTADEIKAWILKDKTGVLIVKPSGDDDNGHLKFCAPAEALSGALEGATARITSTLAKYPYLAAGHDPRRKIYENLPDLSAISNGARSEQEAANNSDQLQRAIEKSLKDVSATLKDELKEFCQADGRRRLKALLGSRELQDKLIDDLHASKAGEAKLREMHNCLLDQVDSTESSIANGFIIAGCILGSITPGVNAVAVPACAVMFAAKALIDVNNAQIVVQHAYSCALVANVCSTDEWKKASDEFEDAVSNLQLTFITEVPMFPHALAEAGHALTPARLRSATQELKDLGSELKTAEAIADPVERTKAVKAADAKAEDLTKRLTEESKANARAANRVEVKKAYPTLSDADITVLTDAQLEELAARSRQVSKTTPPPDVHGARPPPPRGPPADVTGSVAAPSVHVSDPKFQAAVDGLQSYAKGSRAGALHFDLISGENAPREEIYKLLQGSYKNGLKMSSADELKEFQYFLVARDAAGRPVAFSCFKETPYGLKIGFLGTDGSDAAKVLIKDYLQNRGALTGVYGEISEAPAAIMFKGNPPPRVVPFEDAKKILSGKGIEPLTPDEVEHAVQTREIPDTPEARKNAYKRTMVIDGKNKTVVKVMVGNPLTEAEAKVVPQVSRSVSSSATSVSDFSGSVNKVCPSCGTLDINAETVAHSNQHYPQAKVVDIRDAHKYARADRSTSVFTDGTTLDDITKKLGGARKVDFDAKGRELLAKGNQTVGFDAELESNGQKMIVKVVTCVTDTCDDDAGGVIRTGVFKKGDVISVFPVCGPSVVLIPKAADVAKSVAKFKADAPWGTGSGKITPKPCP